MRFRARLRTRWSDDDLQGVLNNAVHPTLLEEARLAYCRELGLMRGRAFPFLLLQSNVRYLRPGRGGVEVTVELRTTRLGTRSIEQAYRLLGPEGEVWCEAQALLVAYDPGSGASAPLDEELRARIARFEGLEAAAPRAQGPQKRSSTSAATSSLPAAE
jgi:acyl-CoA thioesterase FadM